MDSLDQKQKSERHVDTDFFWSIDVSGSLGSFILGVLVHRNHSLQCFSSACPGFLSCFVWATIST